MERKFLVCRRCGNLVEMINDSLITPMCCGMDMELLIAGTVHADREKHIPVIQIDGNKVWVLVGSFVHPMEENHYIMWIYLETNMGIKRVKLNPLDEAKATFALLDNEKVISAYAYCNLHGLWIKEME